MGKGESEVTYPQWDDWDETDDCYLFEFSRLRMEFP